MKRLPAAFALATLCAGTLALAQQPPTQTPQQPPASGSQQTAPDPSTKEATMRDCLEKVQAANPQASKDKVQAYCDKKVEELYTSPPKG